MEAPTVPDWRAAVASERGPRNYTLRLALLALAVIMDRRRRSVVRASTQEIATASGLSRRWVAIVLKDAVEQGWLVKGPKRAIGHLEAVCEFEPRIPDVPRQTNDAGYVDQVGA